MQIAELVGSGAWGRGMALGLAALVWAAPPAAGQLLDAAWGGREQAAPFFQASLEKERRPPDWDGVIQELEKCIELSPEPSWQASIQDGSGRWRRHYLPYFYVGRAYWHKDDCPAAVEWLSTALDKGEVCKSKQGDLRELEKLLLKCEQRGTELTRGARELVRDECAEVQVARLEAMLGPATIWTWLVGLAP